MKTTSCPASNTAALVLLLLGNLLSVWSCMLPAAEPGSTERNRIAQLLQQARQALAEDRLTVPPGNNAVAYAQQVLDLDPGAAEAHQILREVVARYDMLGESVLARAQAESQRALGLAETYRQRAGNIVKRFRLPETDLKLLGEHVTAARASQGFEQPAVRQLLQDVVNRYLKLGAAALERGDMEEARRHQAGAQSVASEYGLLNTQVLDLARRIEAEAPLASARHWKEVSAFPEAQQLLAEVVITHVALGEAALSQGAVQEARWHRDRAQALVAQYRLPDEGLRGLNQRLARAEVQRPVYRVYGTF